MPSSKPKRTPALTHNTTRSPSTAPPAPLSSKRTTRAIALQKRKEQTRNPVYQHESNLALLRTVPGFENYVPPQIELLDDILGFTEKLYAVLKRYAGAYERFQRECEGWFEGLGEEGWPEPVMEGGEVYLGPYAVGFVRFVEEEMGKVMESEVSPGRPPEGVEAEVGEDGDAPAVPVRGLVISPSSGTVYLKRKREASFARLSSHQRSGNAKSITSASSDSSTELSSNKSVPSQAQPKRPSLQTDGTANKSGNETVEEGRQDETYFSNELRNVTAYMDGVLPARLKKYKDLAVRVSEALAAKAKADSCGGSESPMKVTHDSSVDTTTETPDSSPNPTEERIKRIRARLEAHQIMSDAAGEVRSRPVKVALREGDPAKAHTLLGELMDEVLTYAGEEFGLRLRLEQAESFRALLEEHGQQTGAEAEGIERWKVDGEQQRIEGVGGQGKRKRDPLEEVDNTNTAQSSARKKAHVGQEGCGTVEQVGYHRRDLLTAIHWLLTIPDSGNKS